MIVSDASGTSVVHQNAYPVWSFLPYVSWFDEHTLVLRSWFRMIHW